MTLRYTLLNKSGAEHIRRQRLLDLEADHFRFVLDLDEASPEDDTTALMEKIREVERRILLHRRALGLPEEVRVPDEDPRDQPVGAE